MIPTVVLDTNILLVSLPKKSRYRPIFDGLLLGHFNLAVINEIISEYREIIALKTNSTIANNVAELLLNLRNINKIDVYFRWNLIAADKDDNKFVDCAIAANAEFIITNDSHFKVLENIPFPQVGVINAKDFLDKLK